MKKRKKPYLLVTLLVIAGIAIGVMNTPQTQSPMSQDQTPKTGVDTKVDEKPADLAKKVNEKMARPGTKTAAPVMPGGPPNMATGPLVLKSKAAVQQYKQRPSESATSTQWYNDETPKEIPKADDQSGGPKNMPSRSPSNR